MKAYVKTEYVTMCCPESNEEIVEMIAEEIAENLRRECLIQELGIDISQILSSNLK